VRFLSHGEQRQVELLLALAVRPKVLLLDEPAAGLSPGETAALAEILRGLPRQTTILLIEHDMDVAFALADRVNVLHYGAVVAEGPPDAVRRDPQVAAIYLGPAAPHA
jgi:branched-chain amino acid transport system ATP-binding protein